MSNNRLHYGWVIILMGLLVMTAAQFTHDRILTVMRGMFASDTAFVSAVKWESFGYSFAVIIGGFLAVRFGTRVVIAVGLTVIGSATILAGLTDTWRFANVMQVLAGLGAGVVFIPALALASAWFAVTQRGFATGIVAAGMSGGAIIASLAVPTILGAYGTEGWRFAMYCQGGAALFIAAMAVFLIRSLPEQMGLRQVGALEQAAPDAPQEVEAAPPKLRVIFKTKWVWFLGLVWFWYAVSHFQDLAFWGHALVKKLGAYENAVYWASVGGGGILGGLLWGWLSDRLGRGSAAAMAYGVQVACYLFPVAVGLYLAVGGLTLAGSGILVIVAATAGDCAGPRLAPATLAFAYIFFRIGHLLEDLIYRSVLVAIGSHYPDPFYSSRLPFLLACALSLVGLVLSLGMNRIPCKD